VHGFAPTMIASQCKMMSISKYVSNWHQGSHPTLI
jgi:hypothetical protein